MEFEIDGKTYRASKIDARKQFHIVRRLAPVMGELIPALRGMGVGKDSGAEDKLAAGMKALPAISGAISSLSDEDADYVIFGLLNAVARKQDQGLGWGQVSTGTSLMYDDISMPAMLRIAFQALVFNMSGFFAALPSDLKEAAQKASGQ